MARLDLFALAHANDASLRRRLEDRRMELAIDHTTKLNEFCRAVREQGGISVNLKPWKMLALLQRGRYLSIYEIASERASSSGRDVEDELRDMQGSYYERRVFFDRSFEDGERFLYGALNIGGAGPGEYGLFCIFLGEEAMRGFRVAFLYDNSLHRYVSAVPLSLDEVALTSEIATPAERQSLAALKHEGDIGSADPSGWAAMLCSRERFVESVFVGDLAPERMTELRISKDEKRRLDDLAFDDMLGKVNASDRSELEDFMSCMERLDSLALMARLREV